MEDIHKKKKTMQRTPVHQTPKHLLQFKISTLFIVGRLQSETAGL